MKNIVGGLCFCGTTWNWSDEKLHLFILITILIGKIFDDMVNNVQVSSHCQWYKGVFSESTVQQVNIVRVLVLGQGVFKVMMRRKGMFTWTHKLPGSEFINVFCDKCSRWIFSISDWSHDLKQCGNKSMDLTSFPMKNTIYQQSIVHISGFFRFKFIKFCNVHLPLHQFPVVFLLNLLWDLQNLFL